MRHAGAEALDKLEPLLKEVRKRSHLRERRRGVFYDKGQARLHFHEDPQGFFADLKAGADWIRFDVSDKAGRRNLLRALDKESVA